MPEEKKMAVEKENTSPAKNKTATVARSGNTSAQVTMLDGSILQINIEVLMTVLLNLFLSHIISSIIMCIMFASVSRNRPANFSAAPQVLKSKTRSVSTVKELAIEFFTRS